MNEPGLEAEDDGNVDLESTRPHLASTLMTRDHIVVCDEGQSFEFLIILLSIVYNNADSRTQ